MSVVVLAVQAELALSDTVEKVDPQNLDPSTDMHSIKHYNACSSAGIASLSFPAKIQGLAHLLIHRKRSITRFSLLI